MKKHIINFVLLLTLVFSLTNAVFGAEDGFNASLSVDKSVAGQIAVTVVHSTALEKYKPTLSIPCDDSYSDAMVLFDGIATKAQYANQHAVFTVAKGGTYYIVSEATLISMVEPTCEKNGNNTYQLNGKNYIEVLAASGHDFSDKHSSTCANCSEINPDYQPPFVPFPTILPTYAPVVGNTDNGDVTVTPEKPKHRETVTIIPCPEKGYEVDNVVVTDKKGNAVTVIKNSDGTYSFAQPVGKVTIEVTYKEIVAVGESCDGGKDCISHSFTDVDSTEWYHEPIDYVIEKGLMNGVGDNLFDVNGTATRAQIITILWRLEGEPVVNYAMSFADVEADEWYTEAIRWAASEKIAEGYGDGSFGTEDAVTREQFAAILYRYEQYKGGGFKGMWMYRMDYTDISDVSDWAYEAIAWCNMNGIITGKGDRILDPKGNAKRSEAAAMLMRYIEKQD